MKRSISRPKSLSKRPRQSLRTKNDAEKKQRPTTKKSKINSMRSINMNGETENNIKTRRVLRNLTIDMNVDMNFGTENNIKTRQNEAEKKQGPTTKKSKINSMRTIKKNGATGNNTKTSRVLRNLTIDMNVDMNVESENNIKTRRILRNSTIGMNVGTENITKSNRRTIDMNVGTENNTKSNRRMLRNLTIDMNDGTKNIAKSNRRVLRNLSDNTTQRSKATLRSGNIFRRLTEQSKNRIKRKWRRKRTRIDESQEVFVPRISASNKRTRIDESQEAFVPRISATNIHPVDAKTKPASMFTDSADQIAKYLKQADNQSIIAKGTTKFQVVNLSPASESAAQIDPTIGSEGSIKENTTEPSLKSPNFYISREGKENLVPERDLSEVSSVDSSILIQVTNEVYETTSTPQKMIVLGHLSFDDESVSSHSIDWLEALSLDGETDSFPYSAAKLDNVDEILCSSADSTPEHTTFIAI